MSRRWTTETLFNHPNFGKLVLKNDKMKPDNSNLRIVICGQIMGGKNNICITRTGHRFPNKKWARWRDDAVRGVREQLSRHFKMITEPVNMRVTYVAGDRRRRDCPAILDAVWHVLEKAGVVADDTLLWPVESSRSYDKDSPRCEIEFLTV